MRATLRDRVLSALVAEFPGTLTNQQLAHRLDAHEPSVRRATLELNKSGAVFCYTGGYSNVPINWRATHVPGVTGDSASL